MNKHMPGEPKSIWMATTVSLVRPSITANQSFDVVVVGAGIAGIYTAYRLKKAGLKVAILEAGTIISDVTGNTTGKLTSQHGLRYAKLEKIFGPEAARTYGEANEWALSEVAALSDSESLECDLISNPAHVFTTEEGREDEFASELDACLKAGLPASIPTSLDLPFQIKSAIRFDRQYRFHPRKFLLGLASGLQIFENSRVLAISEKDDHCELVTDQGVVRANSVVVATNYPIFDSNFFLAKLSPYRSYALALEVEGDIPEGMFVSEGEILRSMRRQAVDGKDLLIVGGEDHKAGQEEKTEQCFLRLEEWARENFNVREVRFRWSAQDNSTPDGLPYIGRASGTKQIYVATGFDGWGMSNGIVAGKLIADLIEGKADEAWEKLCSPSRIEFEAVPTMIKENLNVAGHLIGDRIRRIARHETDSLANGEAAIVQLDDKRIGAFRDDTGSLHLVSTACTHMGCQLAWNGAERSWDCPCHGSRFDVDGRVLHSPAVKALETFPV